MYNVMSCHAIQEYRKKQISDMRLIFSNCPDDLFEEFMERQIKNNYKEVNCTLYNNYENTEDEFTVAEMIDWIEEKEPIITEHGVMFKNHNQAVNNNAKMLEYILGMRKKEKNLMFQCKENNDFAQAAIHDTKQKIYKIIANSYYGISGQSSSIFYNLHVVLSVTGKGQSIISTAMTTFERFMGNTIKWRSLDECTSFINYVVNEEDNYTLTDIKDRTKEEVVNKLLNEMQEPKPLYKQVIERLISHLDQNKLNKLYYKNNFYDFIANESILELYNEMISLKDVDILDPNEIPDVFVDTLEKLWFSLKEYVFHNFITYNKIEILKHNPREVVLAVDTDSNFLYMGKYYDFLKNKLNFEETDTTMIKVINIQAAILANIIAESYAKYTKQCNVPEDQRWLISMKNEFLYSRILFTSKKKNYTGNIICQEGVMLDNHHDIKGLAIKKSNINRQVGNTLQTLLHDDILKSKEIDVRQILVKLNELEESIRDTFRRGETKYLTPTSCKVASSYKNPATIAPFRAAVAWNAAYPNNPIVLPENFNQFKCTITSLEDIAPLYDTHPDIYKRLKEEIFDNETFKKYGITYFAIPKNVDKIPEWIIPYVDVDTIINDNLSVFNPVLESLGLKILSNTKGDFYSNIISI